MKNRPNIDIEFHSKMANLVNAKHFSEVDYEKSSIEELLNSTDLQFLLNHINGFVLIFNYKTGYYEYISEGIKTNLGFNAKDYTGPDGIQLSDSSMFDPHGRLLVQKIMPDIFKYIFENATPETGKDYRFKCCMKLKDSQGKFSWYLLDTLFIQTTEAGFPYRTLVTCTNIDDYKKDEVVYYNLTKKDQNGVYQLVFESIAEEETSAIKLTTKEFEVLNFVCQGYKSKEIANRMLLSLNTIHNHRKSILKKTNCNGVADLTKLAFARGLI